jgi:tape measure domain-containing protein
MTSLWGKRHGLLRQLDRLLASGRITSAEADRLREATSRDEFDAAARDIGVRHAQAQLASAVEAGELTEEEARRQLEVLRDGEHRRTLRGHSRRRHETT